MLEFTYEESRRGREGGIRQVAWQGHALHKNEALLVVFAALLQPTHKSKSALGLKQEQSHY